MRRVLAIQLLTIFLLLCLVAPDLASQTQMAQPIKNGQTLHQRQGFFDYALSKINPSNGDYGAATASTRDSIVGHTIDDLYFWSNLVTLILLGCAAGILYFEWRAAAKKEIIAASIIAELWNGRISDTIEITSRTEQRSSNQIKQSRRTHRISNTRSRSSNRKLRQAAKMLPKARPMCPIRVWLTLH